MGGGGCGGGWCAVSDGISSTLLMAVLSDCIKSKVVGR